MISPRLLAGAASALAISALPSAAQSLAPEALPLRAGLEENRGQHDPDVRYMTRTGPGTTWLTDAGSVLDLGRPTTGDDDDPTTRVALVMTYEDAAEDAPLTGLEPLPTRLSFFHAGEAEDWITDVPTWSSVRHEGVWSGIDVCWKVGGERIEYDFELAPGADPDRIRLAFEGADELSIGPNGELFLETPLGRIVHTIPRVWQESEAGQIERRARFVLRGGTQVGFAVDERDPALPLVIDPVVDWGTYFDMQYPAASGTAGISQVTVAGDGTIAFCGTETTAWGMPSTPGVYQQRPSGSSTPNRMGYVGKMSADGGALLWLSYIGDLAGASETTLFDVGVLSTGQVVVAGRSRSDSTAYPITSNTGIPYDAQLDVQRVGAALTVFSADGTNIDWSSIPVADLSAAFRALVIDPSDDVYVVGEAGYRSNVLATPGAYLPTVHPYVQHTAAAKVDLTGGGFEYFTFVTSSSGVSSGAWAAASDAQGRLFFSGYTSSAMPIPNGFANYDTNLGGAQYYVGRLNADGSNLEYATVLRQGTSGIQTYTAAPYNGGPDPSIAPSGIATDGAGRVWVASIAATGFSPNTYGPLSGALDAALTCLDTNAAGTESIVWARPFGGSYQDIAGSVGLVGDRVLLAGNTRSMTLPCASSGLADVFVASFDRDTGAHQHTWLVGGELDEFSYAFGILTFPFALGPQGQVIVGGQSASVTGVATPGAYYEQNDVAGTWFGGTGSAPFLSKIGDGTIDPCGPTDDEPPVVTITAPPEGLVTNSTGVTLTADVADDSTTTVVSSPGSVLPGGLSAGGGTVSGDVPLSSEGGNVLTVNAVDEAGNAGGSSVTVYRDTIPPVVTISPAEGAIVGMGPVQLLLTVHDQTHTTVTVNGGSAGAIPVAGGAIYGSVSGSLTSLQALAEGANAFSVTATDAAGNQTAVVLTIVLDSTAPIVTIDDPANGEWFSATPVPLVATIDDESAVVVSGDLTASLPAGGGIVSDLADLGEGWNELTVVGTDTVGNSASASVSVLLDTTPSTVAIVSPGPDALVRGTTDYDAVAVDHSPGSGVATVELLVDGAPHASYTTGPYESLLDTTLLVDGWHTLTAIATDGVGNTAQHELSIQVDNTPPIVTIVDPAAGVLLAGDLEFTAWAQDAESGLVMVEMRSGGSVPALVDGSTSYATPLFDDMRTSIDVPPATDGPWTLSARAVDAAGNEGATSIEVFTDNSAPDKTILTPADGTRVSGLLPIEVDAYDPNLEQVELYVAGTLVTQGPGPALSVLYDTTQEADGPMDITVVVVDTLGQSSTCTITVTVDNSSCLKLRPRTLNLQSKGGDKSVTAKACGYGLEALLPTEDAELRLCVPGGSPVPSTADFAGDDNVQDDDGDGFGELLLKFDRQLLIASIRAGLLSGAITDGTVTLTLKAGDDVLASDAIRLIGE